MSRTRRRSALPLAAALCGTSLGLGIAPAQAANPSPDPTPLEQAHAALSREAATQGMVLLENRNRALPIPRKGNVAVFGVGSYKTVQGGTGSGQVNNRYLVNVRKGLEEAGYRITTSDAYYQALVKAYDEKYPPKPGVIFAPAIDYASVEQPLTDQTAKPIKKTDTALYVVARNSGEGADRSSGAGDYLLTDTEKANLAVLGKHYKKVVVVLNTGGIMDTSFFSQVNARATDPSGGTALDSLLLMSQAGQESGRALADVLNGTVSPSGKLTDTWASAYKYYPASQSFAKNDGDPLHEQYSEGIYVGYRYFDSFYRTLNGHKPASVVNYPFGYGLGYTTFALRTKQVKADMNTVRVRVQVTNTGRASGREVVQVYFSAPTKGLDKPYQELAGSAKTDVLKPGQSQTVTVSFRTTEMSSYDEDAQAYVMDAGNYLVRVGNSSRSTHVEAKLALPRRVVTERLHSELTDDAMPDETLTASPQDFYSYRGEAREVAKARKVALNPRNFRAADSASPYEQDLAVNEASPYYEVDRTLISRVPVYLAKGQKDWEGTGKAYQSKTGEQARTVATNADATLYDVRSGKITMEQFVAGLSLEQLANIVEGTDRKGSTLTAAGAAGYTTPLYESKGIPGMVLADGPAGLRLIQKLPTSPVSYQYTTAWPVGTLLAQSWDPALLKKVGVAIGAEMNEFGVSMWLAPGMNIHRDPLNGRNFEYYSEDPLVSGQVATQMTLGVQANPGVGVTLKHFAANNQETNRTTSDSVVGERALREVYLKGFELAVKQSQPMAVMSSYNKVNGTYTVANYDLLTDVLRGEWDFQGMVMSDWTSANYLPSPTPIMYGGNDLIEPGNGADAVIGAVKQLAPVIDVAGLPQWDRNTMKKYGFTSTSVRTGSWQLNATGTETIRTVVNADSIAKQPVSTITVTDEVNNITTQPRAKYTSVDEAYKETVQILGATGFGGMTAAQKAGVSIADVQRQTPGDDSSPVVSYTVVLKGNYPAKGYALRLGDLQRSAMRVLDAAMQTSQFAQLAQLQGVKGMDAGSYSGQFDLPRIIWSSKSGVTGRR
ncbi:glycoside hydrolase family 3 N-terminal domain-containing protein [Luteococcus sp. H138]|uniref:glycoside hydrolase family 3 protein n=1 Tax=unclassified Luteococcus TaxID=2639923 RepID=UPI00313E273F